MKPLFGSNVTENPSPETVLSAMRSVPAGAAAAKRAAGSSSRNTSWSAATS